MEHVNFFLYFPFDSAHTQGNKVNGDWTEFENECKTQDMPATDTNNFKMGSLQGDTYYRIELRAHNAIGFSQPALLMMRTARGESSNKLFYSNFAGGFSGGGSSPPYTSAGGATFTTTTTATAIITKQTLNIVLLCAIVFVWPLFIHM